MTDEEWLNWMNDGDLEQEFAGLDPEIAEAILELIKRGLVVDSGRRRNGKILWVAACHKAN